jgi:hypothetical protein
MIRLKKLILFSKAISALSLIIFIFLETEISPVLADQSPVGCGGSSLGIHLFTPLPQVHIGDTISYSIRVFNGTPGTPFVSCDASDIQASITTPDGIVHNVPLIRTALSDQDSDYYDSVVTYIATLKDMQAGGTLNASASDTGIIHQNVIDGRGGGFQSLNVTVIANPVPGVNSNNGVGVTVNSAPVNTNNGAGSTIALVPAVNSNNGVGVGISLTPAVNSNNGAGVATATQPSVNGNNNTGVGIATPPMVNTNNGQGSTIALVPSTNTNNATGAIIALSPMVNSNNGAGVATAPPPTVNGNNNTGVGIATAPPINTNNGQGSTIAVLPSVNANNGGGNAIVPLPPTNTNNGTGTSSPIVVPPSVTPPPVSPNNGGGSTPAIIPPPVTPPVVEITPPSGGGTWFAPQPIIKIVKTPSVNQLTNGPGPVTYTYTITNASPVAISNVTVVDDKCSPVKYISGDINSDEKLDTTETWIFQCTQTLTQTTLNTATAHGNAYGWDTFATATSSVSVNSPVLIASTVSSFPSTTATSTVSTRPVTPRLPNTGFSPDFFFGNSGNSNGFNPLLASLLLLISSTLLLYYTRSSRLLLPEN